MRFLVLGLVCLCFGCGPTLPTRVQSAPDHVGVDSLAMHYAARGKAYDGRLIQVRLAKGTFRVHPGRIEANLCGGVGLIRFETTAVVPEADLVIVGTCRGTVADGQMRCGYSWFIRVEGCVISAP